MSYLGADQLTFQDGLLAARILASLFKQDDIPYRLVPIGGYSELEGKRDEALASEEVREITTAHMKDGFIGPIIHDANADHRYQLHTLILLSLGSLLPLSTYFPLPKGCHLHIIDSHRPWNLQNLFALDLDVNDDEEEAAGGSEGRIWVWGDGDEGSLDGVKKSWEALEVGSIQV